MQAVLASPSDVKGVLEMTELVAAGAGNNATIVPRCDLSYLDSNNDGTARE